MKPSTDRITWGAMEVLDQIRYKMRDFDKDADCDAEILVRALMIVLRGNVERAEQILDAEALRLRGRPAAVPIAARSKRS
jgi:hypothetical protein